MEGRHIAILDCDTAGCTYAMLYASGGHKVVMYDVDSTLSEEANRYISQQLDTFEAQRLLKGSSSKDQQRELITFTSCLRYAVSQAFIVQECSQDNSDAKTKRRTKVDQLIKDDTVIISSGMSIMPSTLSETLAHRDNFLVVNHIDPLYYLRAMEIVPAKWTSPSVVERTVRFLKDLGQTPAVVKKEIPGFLINRIQAMIMRESYRLVHDGVMSASDCDTLMTHGIGLRYAFMGQWEAVYLDSSGMYSGVERYGDHVYDTQTDLKAELPMEGNTLDEIKESIERVAGPPSNIPERQKRFDKRLAALVTLKKEMEREEK